MAAAVLALGVVALAAPAGSQQGNQDDITHIVTSGTPESPDGKFSQKLEGKGAVATFELSQPGVYPYFCERHRSMRGEIRVK
jgi:plastocyanin